MISSQPKYVISSYHKCRHFATDFPFFFPFVAENKKRKNLFEKRLTNENLSCIISFVQCESGGTGRRARLRGVWFYRTGSSPVSRTTKRTDAVASVFFVMVETGQYPSTAWVLRAKKHPPDVFFNALHFSHHKKNRCSSIGFFVVLVERLELYTIKCFSPRRKATLAPIHFYLLPPKIDKVA